VLIDEPDDKEAWRIAKEIADYITKNIFKGTVNVLEDECIKRMLALFKKKTYVAMENENVKTGVYEHAEKGIASVRRDKPPVLTDLLSELNHAYTGLGHYTRETIATVMLRRCCDHYERIVSNDFPDEAYIIWKRINKVHAESEQTNVAKLMEQRTGMVAQAGDSVPYVHVVMPREDKARRRVDAPSMVKNGERQIDRTYYLTNKLGPIESVLMLFLPPEVIERLSETYVMAAKHPGMTTIQMGRGPRRTMAEERRHICERALEVAIKSGRMPRADYMPEPLRKRKAAPKLTDEERDAMARANDAYFSKFLSAKTKEENDRRAARRQKAAVAASAAPAPAKKKKVEVKPGGMDAFMAKLKARHAAKQQHGGAK